MLDWEPEKYRELYEKFLEEIEEDTDYFKLYVPKWKKDTLLLLTKAMEKPAPKPKYLRKKINKKIRKIMDDAICQEKEMIQWNKKGVLM